MYGFDHGVWMLGGWMVVLVLWLLPFTLLFVAIKIFFDKFKAGSGKSALDILEEAYASGNISRDEFLQKRDDMQKSSAK